MPANIGFTQPLTMNAYASPMPNQTVNPAMGVLGGARGYANQSASIGQQGMNAGLGAAQGIQGVAGQLQGLGSGMFNEFAGNQKYADKALSDAFDVGQTGFSSKLGSLQDQTSGVLARSGLAGTPYGAAVNAGATGNFLNNWQDQQINRHATGAGTATALQGQHLAAQQAGGNLINAAGQLDTNAMNGILASYGLSEQASAQAAQTLASIFGGMNKTTNVGGAAPGLAPGLGLQAYSGVGNG